MKKVILASLITGCGYGSPAYKVPPAYTPQTYDTGDTVIADDDSLKAIVGEFYSYATTFNRRVRGNIKSITFVDDMSGKGEYSVGLCYIYSVKDGGYAYSEIELLKPAWDWFGTQDRRTLVFHELGHCALDLDHVEFATGAIMEPSVIDNRFAEANWFQLVKDEFSSSNLGLTKLMETSDVIVISLP